MHEIFFRLWKTVYLSEHRPSKWFIKFEDLPWGAALATIKHVGLADIWSTAIKIQLFEMNEASIYVFLSKRRKAELRSADFHIRSGISK